MTCGCHADERLAPLRAGGCPSFVPADLLAKLRANRDGAEFIGAVLGAIGASLVSSVVLAPIGAPIVAGAAGVVALANNCDGVETVKANARVAAEACRVGSTVCAVVGGILGTLGVGAATTTVVADAGVTITVAAGTAAGLELVALVLNRTQAVLEPIGKGRAPSFADVLAFTAALSVASVASQWQSKLDALVQFIGDASKTSAQFQAAVQRRGTGGTMAMRPTSDDVNLQAFATELLTRARNGDGKTTLDRFFMLYVATAPVGPLDRQVTGGPSAQVKTTVTSMWRAWRNAGHPTTPSAILNVMRPFIGRRAFFRTLEAAFAAVVYTPPSTPKNVNDRYNLDRITGPRNTTPPPDDEGGGLGLLVGVGLALKFLL